MLGEGGKDMMNGVQTKGADVVINAAQPKSDGMIVANTLCCTSLLYTVKKPVMLTTAATAACANAPHHHHCHHLQFVIM